MVRMPQTKPEPALRITDIRPTQIEYLMHMVNGAYVMQEDVEYWFQIDTHDGDRFAGLGFVARDKFMLIANATFVPRSSKEMMEQATPIDVTTISGFSAWEVI